MSDVFISHSSKDKEIANAVVDYLESKDIPCWIAPRDIVAGSDWAASINTAITTTKVFMLIYSENSAKSDQCVRELGVAESKKSIFVVPYKVDETALIGTYEYYLTNAHWVNANYKKNDYRFEELFVHLSGLLGKSSQVINVQNNIQEQHIHNNAPATAKSGNWLKDHIPLVAVGGVALVAVVALIAVIASNSGNKAVDTSAPAETTAALSESITTSSGENAPTDAEIETFKNTMVKYNLEGDDLSWEPVPGAGGYEVICAIGKDSTMYDANADIIDTSINVKSLDSVKKLYSGEITHVNIKVRAYMIVNGEKVYSQNNPEVIILKTI